MDKTVLEQINDNFKLQWNFGGRRYGLSTHVLRWRLIGYIARLAGRPDRLSYHGVPIVRLDNIVANGHEIVQAMLNDPAFNVTLKPRGRAQ